MLRLGEPPASISCGPAKSGRPCPSRRTAMVKTLDRWRHEVEMRMGASTSAKASGSKERGNAYHRKVYRALGAMNLPGRLLIEPWYRNMSVYPDKRVFRSPDAVIL